MTFNLSFVYFLLVAALSFLIGLEVRSYRKQYYKTLNNKHFFGDVRTYTFVGILGFILVKIDNNHPHILYLAGFLALTLLYALLYYRNLLDNKPSILLFVVMLLVYSYGALIQTQPLWMTALLYVSIVFILNFNRGVDKYLENINSEEFEIFGKMVLLSAVILPVLPNTNLIPYIPLSPFKLWLIVVVISGISYTGYVIQKYFFPSKGYYLTGIIGGSYSSTATTVVLARKAKALGGLTIIDAAIISATSVMYLRLIIVALIFNIEIAKTIIIPFTILALIGFVSSSFYLQDKNNQQYPDIADHNPLELKTALMFALLFVIMMIITKFVTEKYGISGLEILSFLVGFTDIDPFILSVLTGKLSITNTQIVTAIMIAAGSNNLLKAIYSLWFGGVKNTYKSTLWITFLGIVTILWGLYYEHTI